MCVELRELRSNGAIRISVSGKSTFDTHIIIIAWKTDLCYIKNRSCVVHNRYLGNIGDDKMSVLILVGALIGIAVLGAIIAVIAAVSGASAAIADEEDEEEG